MHLIDDEAINFTNLIKIVQDVKEARAFDKLLWGQVDYFVPELPDLRVELADVFLFGFVITDRKRDSW